MGWGPHSTVWLRVMRSTGWPNFCPGIGIGTLRSWQHDLAALCLRHLNLAEFLLTPKPLL